MRKAILPLLSSLLVGIWSLIPATTFAQLAAPTSLQALAWDYDRIFVRWDTVAGATGYRVFTSTDSVNFTLGGDFLGETTDRGTITGLSANTDYDLVVEAYGSAGTSNRIGTQRLTTNKAMTHNFPLNAINGDSVLNTLGSVPGKVMGPAVVVPAGSTGLPFNAVRFVQDEIQGILSWIRLSDALNGSAIAPALMSRSLSVWFKNDQPSLYASMISFGKREGLSVVFKNDSLYVATKHRIGSPWFDVIQGVPFSSTSWHHLAYVYKDPFTKVYLDGVEIMSIDGTGAWPYPGPWVINGPGDRSYEIGGQEDPDFTTQKHLGDNFDVGIRNLFYGEMSRLQGYNYDLSPAEVLALYAEGLPAAPANFRVVASDIDRLYLAWTAVPNVNQYIISQSSDSVTFAPIDTLTDPTASKYAVAGLMENTQYYFRIEAVNTLGTGTAANATGRTVLGAMIHHFPLDALSADSVLNVLGGRGGKVMGQVTVVPANTSGLPVPALKFNQDELQGIQSWIRLSDAMNQGFTGLDASLMSRTVSFWMKNDQPSLYSVPISFGKREGLTVAFKNDSLFVATKHRVGSPWFDAIGGVPYTSGSDWVLLTYVYRDPITTVYLNGEPVFSFDGSNEWPFPQRWVINGPGDRSYEIGGQEDPDFTTQKHLGDNFDVGIRNLFYGEMAQLKTWNYARPADSIRAEFAAVFPVAPTDFRVVSRDVDRMYFAWTPNAIADGYKIDVSEDGTTFTQIVDVTDGTANKKAVDGLTPQTVYSFRITPYIQAGPGTSRTVVDSTIAPRMIHHFPLDAVVGDSVVNVLGGRGGKVMGQVTVVPANTTGLPVSAVRFNQDELQGVQSWIRLSDAMNQGFTGLDASLMSRTVSFWMKNDQPSLYSVPLSFGKREGLTVAFKNDSLFVATKHRVGSPWFDAIAGVPSTNATEWQFFTYVYRDPITTVYLNGDSLFSFDGSDQWPYPQRWVINGPGDRSYEIGGQEDPDFTTQKHLGDNFDVGIRNLFHGEMAQLKTWNYARSADSIAAEYAAVVSIEKVQSGLFQVYPNPASDRIEVEFESGKLAEMDILSLDGRTIQSFSRQPAGSISVANLSPGVYFLRVRIDNRQQTTKVVVFK